MYGDCKEIYKENDELSHLELDLSTCDFHDVILLIDLADLYLLGDINDNEMKPRLSGEKICIVKYVNGKQHRIHRLMRPDWKNIHHIDGDMLNCRGENLREGRRNQLNHRNTSGVAGVFFESQSRRWVAKVSIDRKQTRLGAFDTKEEAIECREEHDKKQEVLTLEDGSVRIYLGNGIYASLSRHVFNSLPKDFNEKTIQQYIFPDIKEPFFIDGNPFNLRESNVVCLRDSGIEGLIIEEGDKYKVHLSKYYKSIEPMPNLYNTPEEAKAALRRARGGLTA